MLGGKALYFFIQTFFPMKKCSRCSFSNCQLFRMQSPTSSDNLPPTMKRNWMICLQIWRILLMMISCSKYHRNQSRERVNETKVIAKFITIHCWTKLKNISLRFLCDFQQLFNTGPESLSRLFSIANHNKKREGSKWFVFDSKKSLFHNTFIIK